MARRRPGTHNARRRFVEQQVSSLLAEQYRAFREQADEWSGYVPSGRLVDDDEQAGEAAESPDADGAADNELDLVDIGRQIRRLPEIAAALNRMWPRLAPHELVHDLLGARPLLASAGRGILTDAEQAALFRARSAALDAVAWTPADVALIDEARTLLGPRQPRPTRAEARERDARRPDAQAWPRGLGAAATGSAPQTSSDEVRSFGHIVVDEAQDLSPMQLRMLARRSISGSMTVVGDIAQATGPVDAAGVGRGDRRTWPRADAVRLVELTVSYRTPAEVVAVCGARAQGGRPRAHPAARRSAGPGTRRASRPASSASLGGAGGRGGRGPARPPGARPGGGPGPGRALGRARGCAGRARAATRTDPRDPAGEGLAAPAGPPAGRPRPTAWSSTAWWSSSRR